MKIIFIFSLSIFIVLLYGIKADENNIDERSCSVIDDPDEDGWLYEG